MRRFISVVLALTLLVTPAIAGRDILIITPKGVFLIPMVDGVPQPKVEQHVDVIIQDLGAPVPPGDPPIIPDPPASDPTVVQIATISKTVLKDKDEAMAVAALIDSLSKLGVKATDMRETLVMAVPIGDTSLKAEGRLTKWLNEVLVVLPLKQKPAEDVDAFALRVKSDVAKIKAGLSSAFGIDSSTLDVIHEAALDGSDSALTAEALDWAKIIQYIQLVIQILRNLGFIPA